MILLPEPEERAVSRREIHLAPLASQHGLDLPQGVGGSVGQFSGFGLVYGTGLEVSLDHRLPSDWLFGISLWIDQSRQHLDLSSGQGELDGTIDLTLVGMGFSFGG